MWTNWRGVKYRAQYENTHALKFEGTDSSLIYLQLWWEYKRKGCHWTCEEEAVMVDGCQMQLIMQSLQHTSYVMHTRACLHIVTFHYSAAEPTRG